VTNLTPGPALDALVASHVMGWAEWKDWQERDYTGEVFPMFVSDWDDRGIFLYRTEKDDDDTGGLWYPSRNIAHAWEVAREVLSKQEDTYTLELTIQGILRGPPFTRAAFWDDGIEVALGEHTETPMAICLAALKAKGVEVEDD